MYRSEQSTWFNPNIQYLFGEDIREYDIRDAGFSLIKEFKLLPSKTIDELSRINKGIERHIVIGKIQRDDPSFSDRLSKAFRDVRYAFINTNHIPDDKIISVKKDALFVIDEVERTKFGQVEFVVKNRYSSYMRFTNIQNLEIYYSKEKTDYKQINDHCIARHKIYTAEFLNKFISMMEWKDSRVRRFIMTHLMKYKSMHLEEEYYLEFNNKSLAIDPLYNYREILIPLVLLVQKEI